MLQIAADTVPDTEHFAADQCHALRNTMDLHFLAYIDAIDRSESWRSDCVPTLEHWVSVRYGMTPAQARDDVMVARVIKALPVIAAAYGEGLLSKDKLISLCSFVSPDDDEYWSIEARRYSASYIRRFATYERRISKEQAAALDRSREFTMAWDRKHEMLRFRGQLPGADGVLFKQALEELTSEPTKGPGGEWIPIEERWADALVDLAAGVHKDEARATVFVHVDAAELAASDGTADIEDGPVIASEVARRLACDGYVRAIVKSGGKVIGIGRRSRVIPKAMERAIRSRDRQCACCGTTVLTWSEVHHMVPWANGGRTDLDNLIVVCRRCHRLIHERGYELFRRPDGTPGVRRPDGYELRNIPTPLRPDIRARMVGPP